VTKLPRDLKRWMLAEPALTLAAAESLTCGRVQARIGEIPGASNFFCGGLTAYSLEQKVRHLGVNRAAAKKVNAVSAEVAEQMARGACELFGSDLAVATTGYAEPSADGGIEEPFAFWALAHRAKRARRWIALRSGRIQCARANRTEVQSIVADAVLGELVAYLEELRAKR
jgi:nicotinamide-nucleotide amidase